MEFSGALGRWKRQKPTFWSVPNFQYGSPNFLHLPDTLWRSHDGHWHDFSARFTNLNGQIVPLKTKSALKKYLNPIVPGPKFQGTYLEHRGTYSDPQIGRSLKIPTFRSEMVAPTQTTEHLRRRIYTPKKPPQVCHPHGPRPPDLVVCSLWTKSTTCTAHLPPTKQKQTSPNLFGHKSSPYQP